MQTRKLFTVLLSALAVLLLVAGCGGNDKKAASGSGKALKIGATAGAHAEVVHAVAAEAKKQGLNVEVVEFTDYITPDKALAEGELDLASYQHKPFMENFNKNNNAHLVDIGPTILMRMGIYSDKVKDLKALPAGATVAIPNDPTNGGRSLLVLAAQGLIQVKDPKNVLTTVHDITANPHHFQFVELEAAAIPRSLDDVTAAAINTTYALNAGLNPEKDPLIKETADSLYVNIVAVREDTLKDPRLKIFQEAYQSPENAQFIKEKFKGSAYVGWKEK